MTDLPPGWMQTSLGDIAHIAFGQRHQGPTHDHDYRVLCLRSTSVQWGRIDPEDTVRIDIAPDERERFRLVRGDLLVCAGGEIGRCAIWPGGEDYMAYPNALLRVRPARGIDPEFLQYQLEYLVRAGVLAMSGPGNSRRRLSQRRLRQLRIGLPSMSEQRRIVRTTGRYLRRIDLGQAHIRRASHHLLTFAQQARTVHITAGYRCVDGAAPLPVGWRWGTVSDVVATIEAGTSWMCDRRPAGPEEWGVIKVSAMTRGYFRAAENKAVAPDHEIDPSKEIRESDLLLSRANTSEYVGASVLVGQCRPRLLLSDKSLRLTPHDGIDKQWLAEVLASPLVRDQMSAHATGSLSTMCNLSRKALGAIVIPIPPQADQIKRATTVRAAIDGVRSLRSAADAAEGRAERLRCSLIAEAFTDALASRHLGSQPVYEQLDQSNSVHTGRLSVHRALARTAIQEMLW